MINELTSLKLQAALLKLEWQQRTGRDVPIPGEVSLAELARRAGLSESTVHQIQRTGLAKVARRLRESGELPPALARKLCALIDHPEQPELF